MLEHFIQVSSGLYDSGGALYPTAKLHGDILNSSGTDAMKEEFTDSNIKLRTAMLTSIKELKVYWACCHAWYSEVLNEAY